MQPFYFYIALVGLCAFYANAATESFGGSSTGAKNILTIASTLGFVTFFALIVASFFVVKWWHPLVVLAATSAIAGITINIGRIFFVGIISAVGVIVFNILAWVNLF
ncbi:MAG: hypothetical protein PHF92_06985 [Bacteroidales bacterium]|nr:hypothetical protein [Bacteroidales bacterium]